MSKSGNPDNFAAPPPKPLGLDDKKVPTNEQARPVPWFCGTARLGVTWLGQPFNVVATPITQEVKKQEPIVLGYTYTAGVAGLICAGPVDLLSEIWMDDRRVWAGNIFRAAADYYDATIPGRGVLRFYWGTETQGVNSHLAALASSSPPNPVELHPAYLGQCYFVAAALLFGDNKTNSPSIDFVLGRWPKPSWQTRDANNQGDTNMVSALDDLVRNTRFGLGMPVTRLNTTALDAAATQLDQECLGFSPVLTRQQSVKKTLVEFGAYVNGFMLTGADGKLSFDLARPVATGGLPAIDEDDLVAPPDLDGGSFSETFNETNVMYSERKRNFKEDFYPWRSGANFATTSEPATQNLHRPWVTRQKVAAVTARIASQLGEVPATRGKIIIRRSSLGSIRAGSLIKLSYAQQGICHLIMRVRELYWGKPTDLQIELQVVSEFPEQTSLHVVSEDEEPPVPVEFPIEDLANRRLIELPPLGAAARLSDLGLAALVARPNVWTTGFHVNVQRSSGSYFLQRSVRQFGRHITLDEAYPAESELVDYAGLLITVSGPDNTLPATTLDDATANRLLLFLGDEILSLFEPVLVAAGQYQVSAIRARFDTTRLAHASGAEGFVMLEHVLAPWAPDTDVTPHTYKLQPFVGNESNAQDPSDVPADAMSLTYRWRRPLTPVFMTVNGVSESPFYQTGDDIAIEVGIASEDSAFWPAWLGGHTDDLPRTIVEILDASMFAVITEELAPGVSAVTIANADLDAALGGEIDFVVRVWHKRNGYLSATPILLAVEKI